MKTTKNKTWYDNVNGISESDFRHITANLDAEVSKSVSKCTKQNTDSSVKNPRIIE